MSSSHMCNEECPKEDGSHEANTKGLARTFSGAGHGGGGASAGAGAG